MLLFPLPPGTHPIKPGYNPATWMLEVTGGSMATTVAANKSVDWPETYSHSELAAHNAAVVDSLMHKVHVFASHVYKPYTVCQGLHVQPCLMGCSVITDCLRGIWGGGANLAVCPSLHEKVCI